MGRIVDINEIPEPIEGYSFEDDDADIVTVSKANRFVLKIDYPCVNRYLEFTKREAQELVRALNRTIPLLEDEDDF